MVIEHPAPPRAEPVERGTFDPRSSRVHRDDIGPLFGFAAELGEECPRDPVFCRQWSRALSVALDASQVT
jgi:hypothetical protein